MSQHELDALVRVIDPAQFSESAHGAGVRIVRTSDGGVTLYRPALLSRLFGARNSTHYFVKRLPTPLVIKRPRMTWSEGASDIGMDFEATYEIHVGDRDDPCQLVRALHGDADLDASLHALIQEAFHEALSDLTRNSSDSSANLLAHFLDSSTGIGVSTPFNERVSARVRNQLGVHFRVGFRLLDEPPQQIEVECSDTFSLADSPNIREVKTSVLLEFASFQQYKKSGLTTAPAIRDAVRKSVSDTIKRHLFGQKYFHVVSTFASSGDSIETRMRESIESDAKKIGYRLQMFQSYPDLPAVKLLTPFRIDMPATDEVRGYPRHATGYVQLELAFTVRATDFHQLVRLIDPANDKNFEHTIRAHVRQVCQDTIQQFDREQFNLEFDSTIVRALDDAITTGLGPFGLHVEIIKIVQIATEEGIRFRSLRSEAPTEFEVVIAGHADAGHADEVTLRGKIEVRAMDKSGWKDFEAKDFGFREDSIWNDARRRQKARELSLPVSEDGVMNMQERRALAIAFELDEIRDRVARTLYREFSTVNGLAQYWRNFKTSKEFDERAQEVVEAAIVEEFGLRIALRGMARDRTASEVTAQTIRGHEYGLLADNAQGERDAITEAREKERQQRLSLLTAVHEMDVESVKDDNRNLPKRVADKLQVVQPTSPAEASVSLEKARTLLQPRPPHSATMLPWKQNDGAKPSEDDTSSGG